MKQTGCTGFSTEAVNHLHSLVQPVNIRIVVIAFRFQLCDGCLDFAQFLVAVHYVVEGGARVVWAFLGNVGDHIPGVEMKLTGVRFQFSENH